MPRDLHCPQCARHLGAVKPPQSLQPGESWVRIYCRGCKKFVVFDQASGRVRHA